MELMPILEAEDSPLYSWAVCMAKWVRWVDVWINGIGIAETKRLPHGLDGASLSLWYWYWSRLQRERVAAGQQRGRARQSIRQDGSKRV